MFLTLIGSRYNLSRSDPFQIAKQQNEYAYNLLRGAGIMKEQKNKNTIPKRNKLCTNFRQLIEEAVRCPPGKRRQYLRPEGRP